jgi:hypothetical protein
MKRAYQVFLKTIKKPLNFINMQPMNCIILKDLHILVLCMNKEEISQKIQKWLIIILNTVLKVEI